VGETTVRVAAVQLSAGADPRSNVEAATELVSAAAREGARYIQLPEYFNYLGPKSRYGEVAEDIPGPTTSRMSALARETGATIHLGSLLERSAEPGRFYNTSVVLDPDGRVAATYRKAHLFDVDVPGEVENLESHEIVAGDELVVADVEGFVLGLSICFDLRFPELYRELCRRGATVLAVPAAFAAATGRAHWEVLLRARAIENHAFVVAAAQVGSTPGGFATWGHTMIVGPWGEVLAASTSDGPDVVAAVLDLDEVRRRRSQIAVHALRRPGLYGEAHGKS
jgi:predicted amidohydrolase